jgi:hypothetical protein
VRCFRDGIKICSPQKNRRNSVSAALLPNNSAAEKQHRINSSLSVFPHNSKSSKNAMHRVVAHFVQSAGRRRD